MVDFHTHILHDIDDGSASLNMSLAMIKELKNQGVTKVVLSPHFYAYLSSTDEFIERRESAASELVQELKKENISIDLYLGCEVLYFEELKRVENLRDFCIKGTNYIIIEMPFSVWTGSIIEDMERIMGMGLIPIIAHFERYIKYKGNLKKIHYLCSLGALLQMNCFCLTKFFARRKALRFIKKDMVFALGTDCHDMGTRMPNYSTAMRYLEKNLPEKKLARFIKRPERLLEYAERIY